MEDYPRLLEGADRWYRSVRDAFPEKVPCRMGCRECCLGLFDITLLDADLLREGLAQADPAVRRDIETRAAAIVEKLRARWPGLEETLENVTEEEIDQLSDELGPVECPVLGPAGECRLYGFRPLTCRLSGVPVVDVSGRIIAPEGCAKCTLTAAEAPRLDGDRLRRNERKILKKFHPREEDVTLFIPQALLRDPT
jgi:Fe-S-cluster containining protein